MCIRDRLEKIEKSWNIRPTSEGVVSRVKTLRGAILPTLLNPETPEDVKDSCRKQLAACYYVQQMSHYPRNYVRQSEKNIPEHILETVERFEEDFTDQVRIHGPLHAVVDVGEAIEVSSRRDRGVEGDPVMDAVRTRLSGMLTALSDESPRI